jgi:hypothetical protein
VNGNPGPVEHVAPWRGALVIVTWICWPLIYFTVETAVRMSFSGSRNCSIEGCNSLEGWKLVLSAALMLTVPVAVTRWWWGWRRRRRGDSDS